MPRRLKTYQTSIGFFDLAIATPSMKAAAEARVPTPTAASSFTNGKRLGPPPPSVSDRFESYSFFMSLTVAVSASCIHPLAHPALNSA
jgi:hypothetical protein